MGGNRDSLEQLNCSKTYKRSDIDAHGNITKSVFHRFSQGFNDPDLKFVTPERALYLPNLDANANNEDRISIQRDADWLQKLYFRHLKDYRKAMEKWKMGTGGGSGADENYADWNTRNSEDFSNYGSVKGDVLAYIYMLDKEAHFLLLAMYDDAPDDIRVEDAIPKNPTKRKKWDAAENHRILS